MVSPGDSLVPANMEPNMTDCAPAPIAFTISPVYLTPPSAIKGIPFLSKLFEITKPETFQTYLSAHRSGDASSAPQNNPLSRKLIEKAEDILSKTDLTNSEIQKYHPLK